MKIILGLCLLLASINLVHAMEDQTEYTLVTPRDSTFGLKSVRIMGSQNGDTLFELCVDKCTVPERKRILLSAIENRHRPRCAMTIRHLPYEEIFELYDEIIEAPDRENSNNIKKLVTLKDFLIKIILDDKFKNHMAELYGYFTSNRLFFDALYLLFTDSKSY